MASASALGPSYWTLNGHLRGLAVLHSLWTSVRINRVEGPQAARIPPASDQCRQSKVLEPADLKAYERRHASRIYRAWTPHYVTFRPQSHTQLEIRA
jgi:hypothetical protein